MLDASDPMKHILVWTVAAVVVGATLRPPSALDDVAPGMTAAAATFLAALRPEQQAKAALAFAGDERGTWNFVPGRYAGVAFGDLDDSQRVLAHDLMRAALSSAGYLKTTTIMELETVLHDLEAGTPGAAARDPGRYAIAVFGAPALDRPWGWRIQGHHVSLNFTVVDGRLAATTPAFLGANPAQVRTGPRAGLRALAAEEDLGRALMTSFGAAQRQRALLDVTAPRDIVLGPGRKLDLLGPPKGLPVGAMNEAQRALFWALVGEYAHDLAPAAADAALARMRATDAAELCFAWAGGIARGEGHYYRIHAPWFAIEYDNTQNDANHVHTVWHDLENPFGVDALRAHLQREHDHK